MSSNARGRALVTAAFTVGTASAGRVLSYGCRSCPGGRARSRTTAYLPFRAKPPYAVTQVMVQVDQAIWIWSLTLAVEVAAVNAAPTASGSFCSLLPAGWVKGG